MASTNECRVTVSIPYFQCKPYIRRAVESILAQTHTGLTIVVVNDGDIEPPWNALAHIDDPRLIRFDLQSNRGRYFADAVVLEATADPYFVIQDADDWSEPQRIATLLRQLRAEHACGAISAQIDHDPAYPHRTGGIARTHDLRVPLDATFKLRLRHHGLYRTDALRAIGGYYGGFRIAYDMLLINLLLMTGRLVIVDQPLYHRTVHADSLSMSPTTGIRSAVRRQATAQLGQIYAEALNFYNAYLAGSLEHADLCVAIQRLCGRHITPEDRAALQDESQRLREHLATAMRATPARPTLRRRAFASTLIADPRLCWSGWAIGEAVAFELQQYLESARPQRILELGSGMSTVLLADYAARHQATFVSLSHETDYYAQTSRLLQEFDLRAHVDLRLAPLQPLRCPNGHRYPWYAIDLTGSFDFVFIDGPPLRNGRQATFFAIAPHLAEHWVAWLHDAARDHEQQCVALWRRYFVFKQALTHPEPRGLFKLSAPDYLTVPDRTASGLGISLLTGGRLGLLQRTIATLRAQSPHLLEQCWVVAMINGDDRQTMAYLEQLPLIDQCLHYSKGILPIGDATSQLMQTLLTKGVEMILHLEDDWETKTTDPDWLQRAQNLLRTYPEVGQIRLRHSSERVLPYHMVTQQPICWEHHDGFMRAPSAHYTFNPSLIRACDVPKIFPCRSEHEAQVNFLRLGAASVQLLPGVFYHIGAHQSRRRGHGQSQRRVPEVVSTAW